MADRPKYSLSIEIKMLNDKQEYDTAIIETHADDKDTFIEVVNIAFETLEKTSR